MLYLAALEVLVCLYLVLASAGRCSRAFGSPLQKLERSLVVLFGCILELVVSLPIVDFALVVALVAVGFVFPSHLLSVP